MDGNSSAEFKELVRSRTDIVQLVGETVALQPQLPAGWKISNVPANGPGPNKVRSSGN